MFLRSVKKKKINPAKSLQEEKVVAKKKKNLIIFTCQF